MIDAPRLEVLVMLGLPIVGAVGAALLGPRRGDLVRWLSLAIAIVTLGLAAALAGQFIHVQQTSAAEAIASRTGPNVPTFRPQFVPGSPSVDPAEQGSHVTTWNMVALGAGEIQFYVGVDGINVWLIVLTAVLFVPSVLVSWTHISERVHEFYAWLMVLQTAMIGIFLSFDIILFYVFFELSLVPLFFLIGIWGGPERRYAARKFLIYTLTGSLISLLGILAVVLAVYYDSPNHEMTFSIPRLVEYVQTRLLEPEGRAYWGSLQFWIFLALTTGFAVKVPLVPLHTWLPLAHVEAPTAGSVDLAGVLLKVGVYGFLRLCVPLAPDASLAVGLPLVSALAVTGVIYGAFTAYTQNDIKRLVAYSSVSHLGLVMLGLFALNPAGLQGSMLQMINHGLSTGGLFLLVGMIYERYHTRKVSDYGGMARRLPLLGCLMVFMVLTSIGMPGLNGAIGEWLVLFGLFASEMGRDQWPMLGVLASTTIVLGAWYLLTMLRRSFFGPVHEPHHEGAEPIRDLNGRELATLAPIALLCVLLGVYPQPFLQATRGELNVIADIAHKARIRAETATAQAQAAEATPTTANAGGEPLP
jgi:NADH-quinone oxidoreductase subunit M